MRLMTPSKLAQGIKKLATKTYDACTQGSSSSHFFQDRTVLITGGSRGLGLVLARQLVALGANVALVARDAAELERAANDLRARGGNGLTVTGDIGQRGVAEQAIKETIEQFGRLDVLINNAGIIQTGPYEHMDLHDFEQAMAVHFFGPLYKTLSAFRWS